MLQQTTNNILAQRPTTPKIPDKKPPEEKKPAERTLSTVEFPDRSGKFRIKVTFPNGDGTGYDIIRIDSTDVVKIKMQKLPGNQMWHTWTRAEIEVVGVPETGWRFYLRQNMWDAGPQSRYVIWDYSQPKPEHPRLEFSGHPDRTSGSFYCVQLDDSKYGGGFTIFVLTPTD